MEQTNIKDEAVIISVYEQVVESIRAGYDNLSKWSTLVLGAWALLMGFLISQELEDFRLGLFLIFGGLTFFILRHEIRRAGQALSGLLVVGLGIERELGIPFNQSQAIATIISFRPKQYLDKLVELSLIEDKDIWMEEIHSNKYALFSARRSLTGQFILFTGVAQIIIGILIMFGIL